MNYIMAYEMQFASTIDLWIHLYVTSMHKLEQMNVTIFVRFTQVISGANN